MKNGNRTPEDRKDVDANGIHTATHWAGRLVAGSVVVYGALIAFDGVINSAELIARENGIAAAGHSAAPEAVHSMTDSLTPDFVAEPVRSGISPDWRPPVELLAGMLIGVAGFTVRDATPGLDR